MPPHWTQTRSRRRMWLRISPHAQPALICRLACSIARARREAAQALDEQVDQLVNEPDPVRVRLIDGRELRGWPAVGPLSAGSAIAGTEPGTDEHLDRLN
jgi:hypothetical protein